MPSNLVIDTGPIVALLDRSENTHFACIDVLKAWRGNIITTEAVLTEALYLLNRSTQAQQNCVELVLRKTILLAPATLDTIERSSVLMSKYHDVPMDYADATLVVLCEELNITKIFTLDRRGFSVFRMPSNKRFEIVP